MTAEAEASDLARCRGADGKTYAVIPTRWTPSLLRSVYMKRRQFHISSDDVHDTFAGFAYYVMNSDALWFSVVSVDDRDLVGIMYLTRLVKSQTRDRLVEAVWHCELWDSRAGVRMELLRRSIAQLFVTFGFHRLVCEIPVKFGGAIRIAKKLGFVPDGRLRSARRYNNVWFDVLSMSLLEDEVAQWVLAEHQ